MLFVNKKTETVKKNWRINLPDKVLVPGVVIGSTTADELGRVGIGQETFLLGGKTICFSCPAWLQPPAYYVNQPSYVSFQTLEPLFFN